MMDLHNIFVLLVVISPLRAFFVLNFSEKKADFDAILFPRLDGDGKINSQHDYL